MNDHRALLGGLNAQHFLRRHWQKRPLLVRGALAGFSGLLSPAQLMKLACRDDMRARLVIRRGSDWEVHDGPLTASRLRKLPARGWSVLVHDVNLVDPSARALLGLFDFIPFARLDDLMVSYAPAGGGVGPHFDSYDVFLLQGPGRRRWRISHQTDLGLREHAALKLLRAFRSQGEAVLEAGDMLYVPPGWAHDGVAVGACMTYSIGFRAPQWQELGVNFLRYLEDRLQLAGLYADPGLKTQRTPAQIAPSMLQEVTAHIDDIRWSAKDVTAFLGQYLTEPKAHVFFAAPPRRYTRVAFEHRLRSRGIALHLKSQMLYAGDAIFINGEMVRVKGRARGTLRELADRRALTRLDTTQRGLVALLYEWYGAGYLDSP